MNGFVWNLIYECQLRDRSVRKNGILSETEENFGYGNWIWNLKNNIVTWTKGFWLVLGFEPEDYTSEPVSPTYYFDFVHPDDIKELQDETARLQ